MNLAKLTSTVSDKTNFKSLDDYITFCLRYLEYADSGLQAVIVSQNEPEYRFFQYKKDGNYNITRPINSNLMIDREHADMVRGQFLSTIKAARDIKATDLANRSIICRSIYTIQQCIGATLDALPVGRSNNARKIAGDLFERLICSLISLLGVDCAAGTVSVPVLLDGVEQSRMRFQHDLIIRQGEIKTIGGVKTSSKDRLAKIFIDKFLYSLLTETDLPHIAIFLNDVQRKKTNQPDKFGINATFLQGHFKAFTIKLNPLDGVYYCDIRPNMRTDPFLSRHIKTIDHFFCEDLWLFVK